MVFALGAVAPGAFATGKPRGPGKETARAQADAGVNASDSGAVPAPVLADRVVVRKSERQMYLMHGSTVLRTYRVALGLNPVGPKEQEGDSRTPEGHYQLTRRNPHSEYFLSIQVSYPNDKDLQRAPTQPADAGRLDHDPRPAERSAARTDVLREARLDGRLHRGIGFGHARDLADDAAGHPDRYPAVGRTHSLPGHPARHALLQSSIVNTSSIIVPDSVDALVAPRGSLENLSQEEITKLLDTSHSGLHGLFRKCALAVLNTGNDTDNAKEILERYADFDIEVVRHARGIKLEIRHAPATAFVDGEMIRGIKEHLFAVLRDVIYIARPDHRQPGRVPDGFRRGYEYGISHPAQRAGPRVQGLSQPGRLLGWPLDR